MRSEDECEDGKELGLFKYITLSIQAPSHTIRIYSIATHTVSTRFLVRR